MFYLALSSPQLIDTNGLKNACCNNKQKSIPSFCFRLRGGLADKRVPSAIDDLAVNADTPFYPSVFDEDEPESVMDRLSEDRINFPATSRVEKESTESDEDDANKGD